MSKENHTDYSYSYIVNKCLKITPDRLKEYNITISERLKSARNMMTSSEKTAINRDLFGLNQCIHLASSIVLLDNPRNNTESQDLLSKALSYIQNKFKDCDPTTILTIATLYYLLKDYSLDGNIDNNIAKYIRTRFDSVNWMIGEDLMEILEIKKQ